MLAPQIAIVLVFFYWPAVETLVQSVFIQDAFGGSLQFVGLENFEMLFADELYLNSFRVTAIFSVAVTVIGLVTSLALAYFADRVIRGAMAFRTMLIVPYAVAPAIVGVLWVFLFSPSLGIVAHWLRNVGVQWNHLLDGSEETLPAFRDEAIAFSAAPLRRRSEATPFPYLQYLDQLRGDSPSWPARTSDVSEFPLALTVRNLKNHRARTVTLELVDYPGERLLEVDTPGDRPLVGPHRDLGDVRLIHERREYHDRLTPVEL